MALAMTEGPILPMMTIGGQLNAMYAFSKVGTAAQVREAWPLVQRVLAYYRLPEHELGSLPTKDEHVEAFRNDVLNTTKTPLSKSIAAMAEYPTGAAMRWQEIDVTELYRYVGPNVITPDAFKAMELSREKYTREILEARKAFNMGARIKALHDFLTAADPTVEGVAKPFKKVLIAYGAPRSLLVIPAIVKVENMLNYKTRVLELMRPQIESEILRLALKVPTTEDIESQGVNIELLDDALKAGIISERTYVKITMVLPKYLNVSDELSAKTREADTLSEIVTTQGINLQRVGRLALVATAVNAGAALFLGQSTSFANAIPCLANVVVGAIVFAVARGWWKPRTQSTPESKKRTPPRVRPTKRIKPVEKKSLMQAGSKRRVDPDAPTVYDDDQLT